MKNPGIRPVVDYLKAANKASWNGIIEPYLPPCHKGWMGKLKAEEGCYEYR
jgi:hypothetical protein